MILSSEHLNYKMDSMLGSNIQYALILFVFIFLNWIKCRCFEHNFIHFTLTDKATGTFSLCAVCRTLKKTIENKTILSESW